MQRRKFLVGMGSLAAGGAAVTGTGAFTDTQIDRNLTGNIVADGSGSPYVDFVTSGNANGVHAEINNTTGEIEISFDTNNNGGSGLSYDSETWFNNLFGVRTHGTGGSSDEYNTWCETHTERLIFFPSGGLFFQNHGRTKGGHAWHEQAGGINLEPGDHLGVGLYVNLDDVDATDADTLSDLNGVPEEDTITFYAERV